MARLVKYRKTGELWYYGDDGMRVRIVRTDRWMYSTRPAASSAI